MNVKYRGESNLHRNCIDPAQAYRIKFREKRLRAISLKKIVESDEEEYPHGKILGQLLTDTSGRKYLHRRGYNL